jgi:hypothetical protein
VQVGAFSIHTIMKLGNLRLSVCVLEMLLCVVVPTCAQIASQGDGPRPVDGVEFILKTLEEYPIVGIGDLPGCVEEHAFIKDLVLGRKLAGKVNDIVVDFGNPRFQVVVDRYILWGEMVPRQVLRHVWDDTTRSLDLTWDSPVYEEFFDTVRAVNLTLPTDQKIRVILADSPLNWDEIRNQGDLSPFLGQTRSQSLADKVNSVLAQGHRGLVISAGPEQFRSSSFQNARALIDKAYPAKFFAILAQGRFGGGDVYMEIERAQSSWNKNTIAALKSTWLGEVKFSSDPSAPILQNAVDAVLYLGSSDSLTKMYPWGFIFQDDDYWNELNRRSKLINGGPFSLAKAGFDLRSVTPQFNPEGMGRQLATTPFPVYVVPSGAKVMDGVDFIVQTLDRYPMVGLGDEHTGLEFYEFVGKLLHDPRLPGKVDDVVVEFGNPFYQAVMDRYIVEGEDVPRDERKGAWEYTAAGWYGTDSPVYERFFDMVRRVNQSLPKTKRIRVILGDASIDPEQLRRDPEAYLHDFDVYHETAKDPREIALAASVISVLARGHRGFMICGDGHLRKPGRPGNSREFIERGAPGKFFLLDLLYTDSDVPSGSVVANGDEALLSLGLIASRTSVRIPPLVFRDQHYWHDINRMDRILRHQDIDLASPMLEYHGRYFSEPVPPMLVGAADLQ